MRRVLIALLAISAALTGCHEADETPLYTVPAPAGSPENVSTTDTWENFAQDYLDTYCVSCHLPDSPRGDYADYDQVVADAARMRCGIADEALPGCDGVAFPLQFPTGPRPSQDGLDRLITWIEAGSPRETPSTQ